MVGCQKIPMHGVASGGNGMSSHQASFCDTTNVLPKLAWKGALL